MIEFKAECGHTVRARDEDAGGVVRCSYCGKPANVPEETGDELDFLFNDIDQPDELPRSRRKRGRKKARTKRARAPGAFNPFAVVLKLCYAALLIAIVIFVGRKFVKPLFEPGGITKRGETDDRRLEQLEPEEPRETVQGAPAAPGLIDREHLGVLYVSSTPPGARVYVLEAAAAPAKGPIHAEPGAKSFRANQRCPYHLQDGEYVVDVALPWVDDCLKSYPNYANFRRSIEDASPEGRRHLVEDYFLPDEADHVYVTESAEQVFYLARQYRHVEVRAERPEAVRALFLPRIPAGDGRSFSIEALVTQNYIPNRHGYAFRTESVLSELEYYRVPAADRPFIREALLRIGIIPYVTPDRRTRLFRIGIHDGMPSAPVIRKASP